jgi:hypothetical protein
MSLFISKLTPTEKEKTDLARELPVNCSNRAVACRSIQHVYVHANVSKKKMYTCSFKKKTTRCVQNTNRGNPSGNLVHIGTSNPIFLKIKKIIFMSFKKIKKNIWMYQTIYLKNMQNNV